MQICRLAKVAVLPVRPLYSARSRSLSSQSFVSRLFGVSVSEPKPKRIASHQTVHGVELEDDFSWLKNRGSKVSKGLIIFFDQYLISPYLVNGRVMRTQSMIIGLISLDFLVSLSS